MRSVLLKIFADTGDALRKLDDVILRKKEATKPASVKVGAETSQAKLELDGLGLRLGKLRESLTKLEIKPKDHAALASFDRLQLKAIKLDSTLKHMKMGDIEGMARARAGLTAMQLQVDHLAHSLKQTDKIDSKGGFWRNLFRLVSPGRGSSAHGLLGNLTTGWGGLATAGAGGPGSGLLGLLGSIIPGGAGTGIGALGSGLTGAGVLGIGGGLIESLLPYSLGVGIGGGTAALAGLAGSQLQKQIAAQEKVVAGYKGHVKAMQQAIASSHKHLSAALAGQAVTRQRATQELKLLALTMQQDRARLAAQTLANNGAISNLQARLQAANQANQQLLSQLRAKLSHDEAQAHNPALTPAQRHHYADLVATDQQRIARETLIGQQRVQAIQREIAAQVLRGKQALARIQAEIANVQQRETGYRLIASGQSRAGQAALAAAGGVSPNTLTAGARGQHMLPGAQNQLTQLQQQFAPFQQFQNEWHTFTANLGKAFIPALDKVLPSLTAIVKQLGGWIGAHQKLFGQLMQASMPFLTNFAQTLEQVAVAIMPSLLEVLKAFQPELPQITKGFVAIAQGLGLFLQAMGPGFHDAADIFVGVAQTIKGIFAGLGVAIDVLTHITWLIGRQWQDFGRIIEDVFKGKFKAALKVFQQFQHEFVQAWDAIRHNVAHILDSMSGGVSQWGHHFATIFNTLRHKVAANWAAFVHDTRDAFDKIRHEVFRVWDGMWNWVGSRVKSGIGYVESTIRPLLNLIKGAGGIVGNLVHGNFGAAAGGLLSTLTGGHLKKLAEGGIVTEPISGIGLHSKTRYLIGEAGPELVTPLNRSGALGGLAMRPLVSPGGPALGHTVMPIGAGGVREPATSGKTEIHIYVVGSTPDQVWRAVHEGLRGYKRRKGDAALGLA